MIKNKKGEEGPSGSAAGTLVGIITLLFIFYILFLPPAERESLLADENETGATGAEEEILLQAAIGRMEIVPQNGTEHYIPNIYLQETKSAQILASINPFTIKKTITSSEKKNFSFGIADPANIENVMLTFTATKREGVLRIKFNDYEIFEGEVTQQNPAPIPISKNNLKESNTILFEIIGFGLPPKEYSFSDAKIIGDAVDVTRMKSTETFPISDAEYYNLDRAWLEYYPTCDQFSVGKLDLSFNDKVLFSGVPSCDSPSRQDLFQEDVKPGKNMITIQLSKGNIGLEQMKLKAILKPTKGFSDFFTITDELYADVKSGSRRIALEIKFIDDGKIKNAQINTNGRLDIIEQRTPVFTRDLSNVIVKGNNYVEIMPRTELNIVKLEIKAE